MASDFGEMAERVGDFRDELADQHEQRTEETMERIRAFVRLQVRQNNSVARRQLIGDIRESEYDANKLVSRHVHVPEWGKYLEHGTGPKGEGEFKAPSNPPYAAISEWAHAKPITPQYYDTIDAAAAAIAQSIVEEGTIPHPFLRPVWYGAKGKDAIIEANLRGMRTALRRL